MNRYQALFQRLSAAQQGAFVPFVTIGDPNPEQSLAIMQTLIDAGRMRLNLAYRFLILWPMARRSKARTYVH